LCTFVEEKTNDREYRMGKDLVEKKKRGFISGQDLKVIVSFFFFLRQQTKDYKTIVGQYIHFIEEVEGEEVANSMEIFISMPRYQAFVSFCKHEMNYVPNTVRNKVKVLSQVLSFILITN